MSTLLERCIHVLIIMNFMFVNQCDYLNDNHYCLEKLPIIIVYIHIYIYSIYTCVLIYLLRNVSSPIIEGIDKLPFDTGRDEFEHFYRMLFQFLLQIQFFFLRILQET